MLVIEKFFKKFDENGDGNITLGELGGVLKKSGKILSADDLKTMIRAMDGNGNYNLYHFTTEISNLLLTKLLAMKSNKLNFQRSWYLASKALQYLFYNVLEFFGCTEFI